MEKRQSQRVKTNFSVKYCVTGEKKTVCDVSRLFDISSTGLKFSSYGEYEIGAPITFYLTFPYTYPNVTEIEGEVVGAQYIVPGKTCKVRVRFKDVTPQAKEALAQLEKIKAA